MTRNNKQKFHQNHKRKSRIRPPFFINKNQQFVAVRKRMSMKTDGPTLNEMSKIDTSGTVTNEEPPRITATRPVSTSNQFKQWWGDGGKQILIGVIGGVILAVVIFIFGDLVYHHNIHLTEHDKDIEYLQKNDAKQDDDIDLLKDKSNELKTDMRLMEQRMDLEKFSQTQQKKK